MKRDQNGGIDKVCGWGEDKEYKNYTRQHTEEGALDLSHTANQCDSNELRAADPDSPLLFLSALLSAKRGVLYLETALSTNIYLQSNNGTPFHKLTPKFKMNRLRGEASRTLLMLQ